MPHLLDTLTRTDTLVAAINDVLVTEGIPGLTLRRIAAASGVSTGSMLHHFGGKARLIRLAGALTATAQQRDLQTRARISGVAAFLPDSDESLLAARVWLAWCELARSQDDLVPTVETNRRVERAELAATLDYQLTRDQLDLLLATIDGLRVAVCLPVRPMSRPHARELLGEAVALVLRGRAVLRRLDSAAS